MKKYYLIIVVLFITITSFAQSDDKEINNAIIKINEKVLNLKFTDWKIYTDKENMPSIVLDVIKQIEDSGVNFLMFGMSKNNLMGCRITSEEADLSLEDYIVMLQEVNSNDIKDFSDYEIKTINDIDICIWDYEVKSNKFKYFEAIVKIDSFDVRITFWTAISLYDKKIDEFNSIIESITIGLIQ